MKFLIAGAGAIGGYIGALMARAGDDVTLFARGPHLRAMQAHGLKVKSAGEEFVSHPKIVGALDEAGSPDVIFLGVKAHALPQLAPQLKPLIGENTTVVSTQNGVPWWFFQGFAGPWEGTRIERVDPGGAITAAIEPRRVLGSIAYFATEIVEPGVIQHIEGNRISLGEPDGTRSERVRKIAERLIAAGLRAPITTRIREEIWVKLLGNVAFNPTSALTGATIVRMARDPEVSVLARRIMEETEAVGEKLGMELPISIDQRMAGAEKVGEHKTSMLQDLETGRPMEIEAVVGAVVELGERLRIPMPHTQAVYACTKLLAEARARAAQ
ncbi:MAG TPA: 2-dehydropantoate 2-reductase [Candidatus Sulfotelmatobacter sp.]|nr:2-dehydropantoate 2-reductase [Candidatus Sulfotelmatobacter sp.]